MNACHRGCRLYSICQFVNGNAGFNTSKEECQGGESNNGSEPKRTLSSRKSANMLTCTSRLTSGSIETVAPSSVKIFCQPREGVFVGVGGRWASLNCHIGNQCCDLPSREQVQPPHGGFNNSRLD